MIDVFMVSSCSAEERKSFENWHKLSSFVAAAKTLEERTFKDQTRSDEQIFILVLFAQDRGDEWLSSVDPAERTTEEERDEEEEEEKEQRRVDEVDATR